jgi:hypothetical protein
MGKTTAQIRAEWAAADRQNGGPNWEPKPDRTFINTTGRCVADRSCVLTGYNPQANPAQYDPAYANNPNLTSAQERKLSHEDVRFDRGFSPFGLPGDGRTEEDQFGIDAPGWPVAVPTPVDVPEPSRSWIFGKR